MSIPVTIAPFGCFSDKEAAKTRRALRMVERTGSAPSRTMQDVLGYYDLIATVPPNSVSPYNHLGLTPRGQELLAQLSL